MNALTHAPMQKKARSRVHVMLSFYRTTYMRQLPEIPISFPGSQGMNRKQMGLWIHIEHPVKTFPYGLKTPL